MGLMHKHGNPVNLIGMSARRPTAGRITERIAAICFKRLANRHGVLPLAGVAQYCLSTEAGFPPAAGVREETRPRVQRTNFISDNLDIFVNSTGSALFLSSPLIRVHPCPSVALPLSASTGNNLKQKAHLATDAHGWRYSAR